MTNILENINKNMRTIKLNITLFMRTIFWVTTEPVYPKCMYVL